MSRKIVCVVGTRPEAIKMAPVILELRNNKEYNTLVLATGQHSDMLDQALSFFDIKADVNLHIMKDRQTLDHITSLVLTGTGKVFDKEHPDMVLVHGDTTTTLGATLSAFYRKIPVGHIEAGLRSWNLDQPFPEEANRVITDRLSTLWFAPTQGAKQNLLQEGADENRIFVTGNTVIDSLSRTVEQHKGSL
ncbi:non-hydrolyzing UDP-N-acetylglucosamine 2-epimerase, partial [Aminobacterium sp. UBA5514]